MNIKGYLFDKDGTLMKIEPYWLSLADYAARKAIKNTVGIFDNDIYFKLMEIAGFNKEGKIIPESPVVSGTNLQIAVLWKKFLTDISVELPNCFVDDVVECFLKDYAQGDVIPTSPNLRNVMLKIKENGCKIGVATSDYYESARFCLEKLGVLDLTDDIFSADKVKSPKPSADTMELACSTWDISPKNIVMVGDSENDMLFAYNSACKGVYINEKEYLPKGADACAKTIDIVPLISF